MSKFSVGLDFGTESVRAIIADVTNGEVRASHVVRYQHGVIEDKIPSSNVNLPPEWALQDPSDYVRAMQELIPCVVHHAGITKDDIVGIGIDFTSSSIMPIDKDARPLSDHLQYRERPHSWLKLWKHHAAQNEADYINKTLIDNLPAVFQYYEGGVSSEWLLPKILQVLNEDPVVYNAADAFIEAGDWVVLQLTGVCARSKCMAGFKSLWTHESGYVSSDILSKVDSRLSELYSTKLSGDIVQLGQNIGGLVPKFAKLLGLNPGTAVATAVIDAHAALPGMGITSSGTLALVMGTSTCHLILDNNHVANCGSAGIVRDGLIPGYFAYEAGQPAVGDLFAWFVDKFMNTSTSRGFQELELEAGKVSPGESGLLVLDWWNGNRSVLMNSDLSGLIVGLTLSTEVPEIYRAVLEGTAFGTRRIIEEMEQGGLEIGQICACGGLSVRNQLLMQIYADVTNRNIIVPLFDQVPALGAAMYGAVAAGSKSGGYDTIEEAAHAMQCRDRTIFRPREDHFRVYSELYEMYRMMHDYFGVNNKVIMKKLKHLRNAYRCTNDQATYLHQGAPSKKGKL